MDTFSRTFKRVWPPSNDLELSSAFSHTPQMWQRDKRELRITYSAIITYIYIYSWGLSAGYQPRPQVVDRGTTARYGGQLRYI